MRRLYIGVLLLLRIDAATIDAVRRTSKIAVFGSTNASHAQHYAATFASLRCGGIADRLLFLDEPAPASAVALAAIGVHVIVADGNGAPALGGARYLPCLIDHAASFRPEAFVSMEHENAFQTGPTVCVKSSTYLRLRFLDAAAIEREFSYFLSAEERAVLLERVETLLQDVRALAEADKNACVYRLLETVAEALVERNARVVQLEKDKAMLGAVVRKIAGMQQAV